MGKRNELYKLNSKTELDDAFFTTEIPIELKSKPLKRGRGSQKKTNVLVIRQKQNSRKPKTGNKAKKVGYLKMNVINDLKADTITKDVKERVQETADMVSDNSTSYTKLKGHVHSHKASVVAVEESAKVLPWVHTAISNAKRQLPDIYYKVKPEYL